MFNLKNNCKETILQDFIILLWCTGIIIIHILWSEYVHIATLGPEHVSLRGDDILKYFLFKNNFKKNLILFNSHLIATKAVKICVLVDLRKGC